MTKQWLAAPILELLRHLTAHAQPFSGSDNDCGKWGEGGGIGHSAPALRDWTGFAQSTMRCPNFRQ